jgi:hypothetical protein
MARQSEPLHVPVKLYRTADMVTVAVPMPGLEPDAVTAEVTADGRLRACGQVATYGSGVAVVALPLAVRTRPAMLTGALR